MKEINYSEEAGIGLRFADWDKDISNMKTPITLLNDYNIDTTESRAEVVELTRTAYDGDEVSSVPSCVCGELSEAKYLNEICQDCNTPVTLHTERPLHPTLWVEVYDGIDWYISPMFWGILKQKLTKSKVSILSWLTDPKYVPNNPKANGLIDKLGRLNIPRGYNYFCNNMEDIIADICSKITELGSAAARRDIVDFVNMNAEIVRNKILPIPNKLTFITEKTPVLTYVDTRIAKAQDAILTFCSIPKAKSVIRAESYVINALDLLSEYYDGKIKNVLGDKGGWWRGNVYSTRIYYGGRAVISSITNWHNYDDLHIPWGFAIGLFEMHLTNKLLKRGFTPLEILRLLRESVLQWNPLIRELFDELLEESPLGKIPCEFLRNPSLDRGSSQLLYITKIKDELNDPTISLSVQVITAPNADFDGDEMTLRLVLDEYQHTRSKPLAPHNTVPDPRRSRKISHRSHIPKPTVCTIANWLKKPITEE